MLSASTRPRASMIEPRSGFSETVRSCCRVARFV
jgi:hypothetical protein